VPGGMERWIWRLCKDGMLLHTYVFCWGVLRMYPRATWVVGIVRVMMMNQKAIACYGISISM
jgi:hypothetical protein